MNASEKMDLLLESMNKLISVLTPSSEVESKNSVKVKKTPAKKAPAKKRGRPKKQKEVVEDEKEEVHLHSIKPQKAKKAKRTFVNNFDPKKIKKTEDEGSAEYKKIKDGGIVKSQTRESHKTVFCNDCKQKVSVIEVLARTPYYCADYKRGECRNAR